MNTQVIAVLKKRPQVPAEAESLIPENIVGKSADEISEFPVLIGNAWEKVGDWFQITVNEDAGRDAPDAPAEEAADLVLKGDLRHFKRLGEGMSSGRMVVEGPVGFHAGARMSGGSLTILGDADDFLGAHMRGGLIVVRGNAGNYTAAGYRGEPYGMKGGTIIVTGDSGQALGARMRRGLVCVLGDTGDVPAFNMKAGTVVIGGKAGVRVGARMVRGTVIVLGEAPPMLPTFTSCCTYRPTFWNILHRHLQSYGFPPETGPDAAFARYSGDTNEGGRGEVLVLANAG